MEIRSYDIGDPANYRLRSALEQATGGPSTESVSLYINGRVALHGVEAIRSQGAALLTDALP